MDNSEAQRAPPNFVVTCLSQGKSSPAHLKDISRQGCSLSTEEEILTLGGVVRLQMAQLTRIEGQVTWQEGLAGGIEFSEPLHAAVVQFIAAQAQVKSSGDMILRDNFGRPISAGEVGRRPSPRGLIDPTMRRGR